MTDKEYIDEIKSGNDKILNILYASYRSKFFGYFVKTFDIPLADIADIYQDSWVGVWENVQDGKLTSLNLNVKLETYLFQVGKYIFLARNRKTKNIKKENIEKLNRFSETENIDLDNNQILSSKRDDCALMIVRNMSEPCSSILLNFYVEQKSGKQIAMELGYQDADSIKTQKYKCMQKVKNELYTQLKKLNLQ